MRFFILFIILISLVMGPAYGVQSTNISEGNLLQGFYASGFQDDSARKAQLADALSFIHSNEKTGKLNSPDGRAILQGTKKLQNYFKVKENFQSCGIISKENGLDQRILDAAATVDASGISCASTENILGPATKIGSLNESVSKITNAVTLPSLQDRIYKASLLNAVGKYWELRRQFPDSNDQSIADLLCGGICAADVKKGMNDYIQERLKKDATQFKRVQYEDVAQKLNQNLTGVNKSIQGKQASISKGYLLNSADGDSKTAVYQGYQEAYLGAVSSEFGYLLRTNTMKTAVGDFRSSSGGVIGDDGDFNKTSDGKGYALSSHTLLSDKNGAELVKKSVEDARSMIRAQSLMLHEMQKHKTFGTSVDDNGNQFRNSFASTQDLKKLVNTNPMAVAQVLMDEPEASPQVCGVLKSIQKDDEAFKDPRWKYAFIAGGIGLTALGVGAVGAGVAGAWLFAGTAAGESLVAAGGMMAGAGTLAGIGTAGVKGMQAVGLSREASHLDQSFLAGSGDTKNVAEARKALDEFHKASHEAIISGAMGAADLGAIQAALRAGKSLEQVKSFTQFFSKVSGASSGEQSLVRSVFEKSKDMGAEKIGQFMDELWSSPQALRVKVLEKLNTLPSKTVQKHVEEALAAARSCKIRVASASWVEGMSSFFISYAYAGSCPAFDLKLAQMGSPAPASSLKPVKDAKALTKWASEVAEEERIVKVGFKQRDGSIEWAQGHVGDVGKGNEFQWQTPRIENKWNPQNRSVSVDSRDFQEAVIKVRDQEFYMGSELNRDKIQGLVGRVNAKDVESIATVHLKGSVSKVEGQITGYTADGNIKVSTLGLRPKEYVIKPDEIFSLNVEKYLPVWSGGK